MNKATILVCTVLVGALALTSAPAHADGDIVCGAGPQEGWQPIKALKKKAWLERWEIVETRIEGDCYEVYARTESGQVVEAFFHPETLEKLLVLRRGQEIFRAPGFEG